jgi:hypothetical protein
MNISYLPQFGCFVKILKTVTLIDGTKGYRVENKSEGIVNMLVRSSELYGAITW